MTWYADLGPIDYFSSVDGSSLRAVGWLGAEHEFATGVTDPDDFERLCALLVDPWQPFAVAGIHGCELCAFTSGAGALRYGDHVVLMGAANVFVPAGDRIFVAPSLVVHYIDAHGYRPPDEFFAAVRACPPMRSMDYKRALLAAGGRGLLRFERS